ncbi:MAG: MFS transporter [Xanthomonadaceae bacterium]|nr:MFS transporter [Xanthomonadaceae bacterium]
MNPAIEVYSARAARFGLIAAFLSSFGQTFFIGLFGTPIRAEFDLDERAWGLIYGGATLASGMLMFWLGAIADHLPARRAITLALSVLAAAAMAMAMARHPAALFLALFALRLGGQGLTGHVAIVVAARHGGSRRGRVLALATLGFILGEALLPLSFAALLGHVEWRWLWASVAAFVLIVMLPALRRLAAELPGDAAPVGADRQETAPASRLGLFVSGRFLAVLPIALISPFVITAVFLHQGTLATLRGWLVTEVAAAIVLFAAAQAVSTWINGRLVDRFGALRLLAWFPLPGALAMIALASMNGLAALWLLFAGLGLSAGGNNVIVSAVWVELFGHRRLGLIRGVYLGLMVLATAVAPALLGLALANAVPLAGMALATACYAAIVPWLCRIWLRAALRQRGS